MWTVPRLRREDQKPSCWGLTSSNLRDVDTLKYYIFSAKLLSSLYLHVDSAEVAQGGPEAVLLGSDEAPFVNDVAADHGRGGGHGGLRLRQQRLHQLRLLTRQVCRLLIRKVQENLSA